MSCAAAAESIRPLPWSTVGGDRNCLSVAASATECRWARIPASVADRLVASNPKRPRTKTKPMKPVKKTDGAAAPKKAASSLKRPAAATDGRPPTPGNSVVYRDARCYYRAPKQGFRGVLNPSQNPSDRFFTFKGCSEKEAWNSVIKFVDENRK